MTIIFMLGIAEAVARVAYPSQESDSCIVPDSRLGLRYKPNCVSRTKSFESPWVTDRYNDCGYRGDASCGPVAPDVRRVVLLGSSLAMGYLVPEQDTFAVRVAADLTRRCDAPVQFQDLGGTLVFWTRVLNRVDDALRLKPQAGLLQISTYDLERPDPGEGSVTNHEAAPPVNNLLLKIQDVVKGSSAWQVAQHYLFQDENLYLSLYLRSGSKSAYLREPLTPFWLNQLHAFDTMLGTIADRFHAAGVPLALVFIPQRAQAALASQRGKWPDTHPYAVNRVLRQIAARHGVGFIDTTEQFASVGNTTDLFYTVDGHLDAKGHSLVAPVIANGMIADLAPFRGCKASGVNRPSVSVPGPSLASRQPGG